MNWLIKKIKVWLWNSKIDSLSYHLRELQEKRALLEKEKEDLLFFLSEYDILFNRIFSSRLTQEEKMQAFWVLGDKLDALVGFYSRSYYPVTDKPAFVLIKQTKDWLIAKFGKEWDQK